MDNKEYNRKYYYNNKNKIRIRANKNQKNIRKRNLSYIISYLQDNPCVDCKEDDFIVLEFDHITDKEHNISNMVNSHSLNKIKEEIAKCEVRCANCHRRKTANQLGWYKNLD